MSVINSTDDLFQNLGLSRDLKPDDGDKMGIKDFMNLMVTELTHQDPFKPMENTELATQISQFATVSGIDELNNSFDGLATSLLSDQTLQAANLVGRDVLIPSDVGYYTTGSTLNGVIDMDTSASDVVVRIHNSSGVLIREMGLGTLTSGQTQFSWDGTMDSGEYAPTGNYYVTAEGVVDGENIAPYTLLEARVSSVSVGAAGQGLALNLEGLGSISFNDVAEIH